ncbi:hypothetical protein BH24ACT5_BH24ACT5_03080 [soil metagenome]
MIAPPPISVIVFGSFARNEADAESDIDLAVIRPDEVHEADDQWSDSLEVWRRKVRSITGNDADIVEAAATEVARKVRGRSELWRDIERDGVVVFGAAISELAERVDA